MYINGNKHPYNPFVGEPIASNVYNVIGANAYQARYQYSATEAVAGSATAVHAAITLGTGEADVNTAITNPSVPRNIRVEGNASGIAGNVVITGTNWLGDLTTETIALNGANAVDGLKAFATVTNINVPVKTNASGDTVSIGFGEKLGLPVALELNTVHFAFLGGIKETTAPTVMVDPVNIENNTIKLNSTLNGSVVDIYLIVV